MLRIAGPHCWLLCCLLLAVQPLSWIPPAQSAGSNVHRRDKRFIDVLIGGGLLLGGGIAWQSKLASERRRRKRRKERFRRYYDRYYGWPLPRAEWHLTWEEQQQMGDYWRWANAQRWERARKEWANYGGRGGDWWTGRRSPADWALTEDDQRSWETEEKDEKKTEKEKDEKKTEKKTEERPTDNGSRPKKQNGREGKTRKEETKPAQSVAQGNQKENGQIGQSSNAAGGAVANGLKSAAGMAQRFAAPLAREMAPRLVTAAMPTVGAALGVVGGPAGAFVGQKLGSMAANYVNQNYLQAETGATGGAGAGAPAAGDPNVQMAMNAADRLMRMRNGQRK